MDIIPSMIWEGKFDLIAESIFDIGFIMIGLIGILVELDGMGRLADDDTWE
jgi:hypothetical protein